jgi:hypothetical protein
MIFSRNLTPNDMGIIEQCILNHDSMYGIPIDHNEYIDRYKKSIERHNAVGAFDGDHCLGICTQNYWSGMPVWTMTNLFLSTSDNPFLSRGMIRVLGSLTEQCIRTAESLGRFEFYYLLRDTEDFKRKTQTRNIISESNEYVSSRYDFINVHLIKGTDDIKWKYIATLLGDIGLKAIQPPHNKTLLVRRAIIKPEFRAI